MAKGKYGRIGYYRRKFENQLSGETLYCARPAAYSVLDEAKMVEAAAKNTGARSSDMSIGMHALSDAINDMVMNGHSVTLDGLGTFSLSAKTGVWDAKKKKWKSAGRTSMDDVSPSDIKGVYVRFRPCTELRQRLALTEFYDLTCTRFLSEKGGYKIEKGKPVKPATPTT